jgi:hypothetical protein
VTDFPSELLIIILHYCEGEDILNFAEAFQNSKIDNLLKNKALWRKAKVGPSNLRKYLKYFGPHTQEITIVGFVTLNKTSKPSKSVYDKSELLPDSVVATIRLRCPNLTTFNLQNCVIDTEKVKLSLFPKTLKSLRLSCVDLQNKLLKKIGSQCLPIFWNQESPAPPGNLAARKPLVPQVLGQSGDYQWLQAQTVTDHKWIQTCVHIWR